MTLLIFILGLIFGSFLNVVIYRLHTGENIIKKRSHCPKCGKILRWHELIPIVSFFLLGGRCAKCKTKISWQYPAVEIISGLLWVFVFYRTFGNLEFGFWNFFRISDFGFRILNFLYEIFILSSLLIIAVYDAKHQIILDKILFPGIIAATLYRFFSFFQQGGAAEQILWPIMAAAVVSLAFFAIHYFSKGRAMGLGDAKLAVLMGVFLGPENVLIALWFAFVIGALFGMILVGMNRKTLKSQMAFGPFLVLGTFIAYFMPWYRFLDMIISLFIKL